MSMNNSTGKSGLGRLDIELSAHSDRDNRSGHGAFRDPIPEGDADSVRMPIMSSTDGGYMRPASNYVQKLTFCLVGFVIIMLIIIMGIAAGTVNAVKGLIIKQTSQTLYYPSLGLPGYESYSWDDMVTLSNGGNVTIATDGTCCTLFKNWLRNYAVPYLKSSYNIKLNVVEAPGGGAKGNTAAWLTYVENKLTAGAALDVDMIWMNGANFLRAKTGYGSNADYKGGNYLYGPWANKVPASANFDWTSTVVNSDFGEATDGYEMPAWQSNFVLVYRTDIFDGTTAAKTPPASFADLAAMVADSSGNSLLNGKFTYASPVSDSTGQGFIRHFLYEMTGGASQYLGSYNSGLYNSNVKSAFAKLKTMEAGLYNCNSATYGKYCDTAADVDTLYKAGSVYMTMTYSATATGGNCYSTGSWASLTIPSSAVKLCDKTKAYVPASGAVANTNFFDIFDKAPNRIAAIVAGNFLGSMEMQFSRKNIHEGVGWIETYSTTSQAYLKGGWYGPMSYLSTSTFQSYPQTPITAQLRSPFALPEIDSRYGTAMKADWLTCVKNGGTSAPCV